MTASSMRRRTRTERAAQVLTLWREESAQPVSVNPPQDLMDLEEIGALDGYGVWAALTARYRLEVEGAQGASREERLKELWDEEAIKARDYQIAHDEYGLYKATMTQTSRCPGARTWFWRLSDPDFPLHGSYESWRATAPEGCLEREYFHALFTNPDLPHPHPISKIPNTDQGKAYLIYREVSRYGHPMTAWVTVARFINEQGGRHDGFKKEDGRWFIDGAYHHLRERAIELHNQGYGYERIAKTLKRESPNAPTRNTIRKYIEQERLILTHLAKEEVVVCDEQLDNNKEKSHETVDPE